MIAGEQRNNGPLWGAMLGHCAPLWAIVHYCGLLWLVVAPLEPIAWLDVPAGNLYLRNLISPGYEGLKTMRAVHSSSVLLSTLYPSIYYHNSAASYFEIQAHGHLRFSQSLFCGILAFEFNL
jgi:hypothetical protein